MAEALQTDDPLLPARFMGVDLYRTHGTLEPREETELLGNTAMELIGRIGPAPRIIDMCCGCGNLATALAVLTPGATAWASDLTDETVAVSRVNVEKHGLGGRVTIGQGDLFAGLEDLGLDGTIDLIVCNPPYISTARLAGDRAFLLENEPREAFDGGPYGIAIHQRVITEAPRFLKPGGYLAMEFGEGQDRQVKILLQRGNRYEDVTLVPDSRGVARVATARLK